MVRKPSIWLMLTMLMFPQVVETIYSPALSAICDAFQVSDHQAAQTLSIYFTAFALGVIVWGIMADHWGRKATMIAGLIIYGLSTISAMLTESFIILLAARAISAFGIAVGSVVTQTILRDTFTGNELGKIFSLMGMGLSISPVIGMLSGGVLVELGGHQLIFATLFGLTLILLVINTIHLPETQQTKTTLPLAKLIKTMLNDKHIWQAASLVALFNIALFAYYQLGSFHFKQLGFSAQQFGYSGLALGAGTLISSVINKILLQRGISAEQIVKHAVYLLLIAAIGVQLTIDSIWFLLPMMLVVMAFGLAIPNILSYALKDYKYYLGSAGAIFGLLYYLLIGGGLALAGLVQQLGYVLIFCAIFALLIRCIKHNKLSH